MRARLALALGVPAFLAIFAIAIGAGYFMGQTSFRSVSPSGRAMPVIPSHGGATPSGPEGSPGSAPAGGPPATPSAAPADQPGGGEAPQNPLAAPPGGSSLPAAPPRSQQAPPQPPASVAGPTTTPSIPAPPSRFHVQAGSFEDRGAAMSLVQQLRDRGYAVTLVEGPPYRIWVGGYLDRTTAERLAANLQAAGFDATLTPR